MKDLGFQGCCLRCDAEDVGGLSRCKSCIGYHKLVKTLLIDDGDSLLIQHMKDLYSMLSNPEMFDNDDIHGAELIYQQSLVSDVDFDGGYTYLMILQIYSFIQNKKWKISFNNFYQLTEESCKIWSTKIHGNTSHQDITVTLVY